MAKPVLYGLDGEQDFNPRLWAVVHHAGSAKQPACGCENRLDHWRRGSKSSRGSCAYLGCSKPAVDGAHVFRATADGKPIGKSYLIPLCATHNRSRRKNPFFVNGSVVWIEEKQQKFCKKGAEVQNNANFSIKITGTSNKAACGCPDALAHCLKQSTRKKCAAISCNSAAKIACLVKSTDGRRDKDNWFAPLCSKHGRKNAEIWLDSRVYLINPRKTPKCGP